VLQVLFVLLRRVLGIRVRPNFTLDHLAATGAGQLLRIIVLVLLLLLLLLDGRKPFFGLAMDRQCEKRDSGCDRNQRPNRQQQMRATTVSSRPARRRGGRRHRSRSLVCKHTTMSPINIITVM